MAEPSTADQRMEAFNRSVDQNIAAKIGNMELELIHTRTAAGMLQVECDQLKAAVVGKDQEIARLSGLLAVAPQNRAQRRAAAK